MSQPVPLYRQIGADLRQQIESGELASGAQLPSEMELREKYGQGGKLASRNTVRDAIQLLISLGLVESRAGQGTFVLRKMRPFVSKVNMDPEAGGVEDEVLRIGGRTAGAQLRGHNPSGGSPASPGSRCLAAKA